MANLVVTEKTCEHCKKTKRVMVAMKPGKDGTAWWLCVSCWIDGVRPMNGPNRAPPTA